MTNHRDKIKLMVINRKNTILGIKCRVQNISKEYLGIGILIHTCKGEMLPTIWEQTVQFECGTTKGDD
jgi:hypothetical protein